MFSVRILQIGEPRGIGATMTCIEFWFNQFVIFRMVVDCGIGFLAMDGQKTQYAPAHYLEGLHVHLLVVTHAHADHSGAVPHFADVHPETIILTSRQTLEFSEVMYKDTLNHQLRDFAEGKLEAKGNDLIFDAGDVDRLMHGKQIRKINDSEWYNFVSDGRTWRIGLTSAGHIQGAMMVFIQPPQNTWTPILVTGDISSKDKHTVRGVMLPKERSFQDFLYQPGLILITEATNGARNRPKPLQEVVCQYINGLHVTQAREGIDMTATFSMDRCAQMALIQNEARFYPHCDGLAQEFMKREISDIRRRRETGEIIFFERGPEGNQHRVDFAKGVCKCKEKFGKEYFTLITPSATLDQGRVVDHAIRLLPVRKNSISMVGHVFPDSMAKQILGMERGKTINLQAFNKETHQPETVAVNVVCDVIHYDGFSGHDYQNELVERIDLIKPAHLVTHHCEPAGFEGLRDAVVSAKIVPSTNVHWMKHLQEIVIVA